MINSQTSLARLDLTSLGTGMGTIKFWAVGGTGQTEPYKGERRVGCKDDSEVK